MGDGDSAALEFGAPQRVAVRRTTAQVGQLPVMSSYPAHGRVQLHSLRHPVAVECAHCRVVCESVLLATIRAGAQLTVVCPQCSHYYLAEQVHSRTRCEHSGALPAAACVTTAGRAPTTINKMLTGAVVPDSVRPDRRAAPGICRNFSNPTGEAFRSAFGLSRQGGLSLRRNGNARYYE